MVGILIKVLVGLALFVGSLVGGLAATGRLNHEGTANIPVLSTFFPEPEVDESAADGEGPADASAEDHGGPAEASHGANDEVEPQGQEREVRKKTGRSVDNPEAPDSGGHGGHGDSGHGDDAHGDGGHASSSQAKGGHPSGAKHRKGPHDQATKGPKNDAARSDFAELEAMQGRTGYRPGAMFHFEGMPSGVTPEQLNAAWASIQEERKQIEQRSQSLELRDQELKELAEDIHRRQTHLSKVQLDLEAMQKQIDDKIKFFENRVVWVKGAEAAKLKENGKTLESFESDKAAEIVQQQWSSERGQQEILRVLRHMNRDSVNAILAELPNPMVQDILKQRMLVLDEPAAPAGRD